MERQQIRLTEEQLNQLVAESVERILVNEGWWDSMKGGMQAAGQMYNKFKNGQSSNQAYQKYNNGQTNVFKNIGQGIKSAGQTIKSGAQNANMQSAIQQTVKALGNLMQQAQGNPGIIGPQTLSAIQNVKRQLSGASGRSASRVSADVNQTAGHFGIA